MNEDIESRKQMGEKNSGLKIMLNYRTLYDKIIKSSLSRYFHFGNDAIYDMPMHKNPEPQPISQKASYLSTVRR